ncbi:MAG: hypothetical protein K8R21_16215 [Leptospira sp.]|nr:hypothetical protein [Leptospira sp.]
MNGKIETKNIRSAFLTMIITSLCLYVATFCKNNDSEFREKQRNYNASMLLLIRYRGEGNCLRTERTSTGKGKIYCDRRPRGLCNSSELILTSGEITSRFSLINDIKKQTSDCNQSIAASGILLEQATTNTQSDTLNSNNLYNFIDQCENSNILSSSALFESSELDFLNSTKGRIAIAADLLNVSPGLQTTKDQAGGCLIYLVRDELTGAIREDLKKLITDNRIFAKVKNVSCLYSDSTPNNCPANLDKFR